MHLAKVSSKIIGEQLAAPIYNRSGMVLLNINTEITQGNISKMEDLQIDRVYIKDLTTDFLFLETLPADIRFKILNNLVSVFEEIKQRKKADFSQVFKIVEEIIGNINISENAFLYDNVGKSNEIFNLCQHSINVATLAVLIGKNRKYNSNQLRNLCTGALLHDVGKIFEKNEAHTTAGYDFCKQSIGPTTLTCIKDHHERFDGQGYPGKLSNDKIYEFAKIVSICNEYINLYMSDHLLPTEALEIIAAKTGTVFEEGIYKEFVNAIYCYPNGLTVKLNTGETGMVFMQNSNFPTRPVVCVYKDGAPYYTYNLIKELTVFIEDVVL